ncbi:MAG: hypothetical protein J6037_01380, partial [Bacteroidales bacterium]|nr:hypothetical protein [Bacteroidales bacterium]
GDKPSVSIFCHGCDGNSLIDSSPKSRDSGLILGYLVLKSGNPCVEIFNIGLEFFGTTYQQEGRTKNC